jgi:hypothetical protein
VRKQGKATCHHFTDVQNRHSQFLFNYVIVDKFHCTASYSRCPLIQHATHFSKGIFGKNFSKQIHFATHKIYYFCHSSIHSFIYLHSPLHDQYTTTGRINCQQYIVLNFDYNPSCYNKQYHIYPSQLGYSIIHIVHHTKYHSILNWIHFTFTVTMMMDHTKHIVIQ